MMVQEKPWQYCIILTDCCSIKSNSLIATLKIVLEVVDAYVTQYYSGRNAIPRYIRFVDIETAKALKIVV